MNEPDVQRLTPSRPALLSEGAYTAAMHLAVDEACLEAAEQAAYGEVVRVWEMDSPTVVLGRGSHVDLEVHRTFCDQNAIPVLRRCSGGATILAGPGCLMYSIVLSLQQRPELRRLDAAHRFVMESLITALRRDVPQVAFEGTCDLTIDGRKFSGNSLRVSREHLLYHGTLMYDADIDFIGHCLRMPPRHPEYRRGRTHGDFLTNIPLSRTELRRHVLDAFSVDLNQIEPPLDRANRLLQSRYGVCDWNYRH